MARQNREKTAKQVASVWRTLWNHKDAPVLAKTNFTSLNQELGLDQFGSHKSIADYLATMAHLGLLSREQTFAGSRGMGPEYTFTLHGSLDDGVKAIARHFAQGGTLMNPWSRPNGQAPAPALTERQENEVAIRTDEKDRPVEAVAGPDAPSPFEAIRHLKKNEHEALVEAARQYAHRQDFVIERLTEIEKLGVQIDREKVMQAITLQRDDELEGIIKVLPYIDELRGKVAQADEWRGQVISIRNEIREIRRERDAALAEAREQKAANSRLAERMVMGETSSTNTNASTTRLVG